MKKKLMQFLKKMQDNKQNFLFSMKYFLDFILKIEFLFFKDQENGFYSISIIINIYIFVFSISISSLCDGKLQERHRDIEIMWFTLGEESYVHQEHKHLYFRSCHEKTRNTRRNLRYLSLVQVTVLAINS